MDQFWRELAERNIQELVVEESRGVITGKLRQTRSGDKPVEFEVSWPDKAFNDAFWAASRDAGIQARAR